MANQKEINSLLELLSLQRDTLAHYLEQLAIQGEAYVLPAVKHGIKETRKEIKRLKISLRQLGVEVDDLPNDEQQANEPLGIRHKLQWTDFVSSVLMLILILWGVFTDSIGLFKIQHSIFGIVLTLTLSFIWFSSIYIHIRKIAQGNWARVPIVVIPLFVTVILAFYEIWQRSFNTYSITLITIGTLSLLFTTYKLNITDKVERNRSIRGKRDKGTKPLERPAPIIFNVRSLVFATILAATFCEILYASKLNADLANKFIILVADIDSGDNKIDDFGIAETILTKLQDNLIDISDVSIEHMNRKISANEGRLIAREEGMKRNATIVIWGWYRAPGQKAQIFVNFELLKAIGPVEKINKETCKGEEIIDINELSSFSIQTNVSDEMSYLALSTLGVARFLRDDWKVSLELFEKAQEIGKEYKAPIFDMFHSLSYLNVAQTILLETGDKDAYFKILSQGIEKGYSVSLTYYFRAGVYKTTEQLQPALDDYTKAISLNQSIPCFYNDRGYPETT